MTGEILKNIRTSLGMSQKSFGEGVGMSQGLVSIYEKKGNKGLIPGKVADAIVSEYHIRLEYAKDGSGDMFSGSGQPPETEDARGRRKRLKIKDNPKEKKRTEAEPSPQVAQNLRLLESLVESVARSYPARVVLIAALQTEDVKKRIACLSEVARIMSDFC